MENKKALITGISGQDGYFMAKLLLDNDYDVYGIVRSTASGKLNLGVIGELSGTDGNESLSRIEFVPGDITDRHFVSSVISKIKPDELYHLAAQSHVGISFSCPDYTFDVNMRGTKNVIDAIVHHSPGTRMYFAGTSEMFGQPKTKPQNESYPMQGNSPYAISKIAAFNMVRLARNEHKIHASCGITYNHESEYRGYDFVTRKITRTLSRIQAGLESQIHLGNVDARKDWGYAGDYVNAFHMMLQRSDPDDYVIATGEQHTVEEFLDEALLYVPDLKREEILQIDQSLYRPVEADNYQGDFRKIHVRMDWSPTVRFKDLVRIMMKHDLEAVRKK